MLQIENQVSTFIEDSGLLENCKTVVVGVSGGPDSTALLHLLTDLYPELNYHCVYVDHNLRPEEARIEQDLVKSQCDALEVQFSTVSVDVVQSAKQKGQSIEECARYLRYGALEKIRVSAKAQRIAVGHTSDDQVEQFFIRLIRGSGVQGLSGMRPMRGTIIRPLLATTKEKILTYLEERDIDYCLDSSNLSRQPLRNRVRLDLLPTLEQTFNRSMKGTVLQTMSILQAESEYLDAELDKIYPDIVSPRHFSEGSGTRTELVASVELLSQCHLAIRRRIVEKMCWSMGVTPTFIGIDTMLALARRGKTGSVKHLSGNLAVIKTHDSLLLSAYTPDSDTGSTEPFVFDQRIVLDGPGRYHVHTLGIDLVIMEKSVHQGIEKTGLVVDAELVDFPLTVRAPAASETFRPIGAPGSKKITRILSDKKIPRHLRYRFPVLAAGDRIIALLDLMVGDDFKLGRDTKRCLLIQAAIP